MENQKVNKNNKKWGKKIFIVVSCIILILFIIIIYNSFKYPSIGEKLEIDFTKNSYQLTEEERKQILSIMDLNNENIQINKISYIIPFRDETSYYITFETEPNTLNNKKKLTLIDKNEEKECYEYTEILFSTSREDFKIIRNICNKYFKK